MTMKVWREDYGRTSNDHLPLPGGLEIASLSGGELANVLIKAGVTGISHSHGRDLNVQIYSKFLGEIAGKGALQAIAEWITKSETKN